MQGKTATFIMYFELLKIYALLVPRSDMCNRGISFRVLRSVPLPQKIAFWDLAICTTISNESSLFEIATGWG